MKVNKKLDVFKSDETYNNTSVTIEFPSDKAPRKKRNTNPVQKSTTTQRDKNYYNNLRKKLVPEEDTDTIYN